MKALWVLVTVAALVLALLVAKSSVRQPMSPEQPQSSPKPVVDQNIDFTASFTIVTGSITRQFTSSMYHNLSPDVYIETANPSIVHVKKMGTTWDDFFKTLPFKLTNTCLTTGTKETFCSGENGVLRFFLNDIENKNLLEEKIQPSDHALITFSQ